MLNSGFSHCLCSIISGPEYNTLGTFKLLIVETLKEARGYVDVRRHVKLSAK
jgi:hypothetical protein